jgi:hypothetical protein
VTADPAAHARQLAEQLRDLSMALLSAQNEMVDLDPYAEALDSLAAELEQAQRSAERSAARIRCSLSGATPCRC